MILFTLLYLFAVDCLPTDSFMCVGRIKAPWVDGLDTKSQHINSKSSCTSTTPSLRNSLTDPKPRLEMPNVIPALKSSFKIFPEGVSRICTAPHKSSPFHHIFKTLCETLFKLTTDDSG